MDDKIIGEEMYSKACEFLDNRFPSGWGGCAIMRTADGRFLISVALENFNSGAGLCMETGAMCEAQKYNLQITHSMCVTRNNEKEKPKILTACGICQERLMYWGNSVKVAVTNQKNEIIFRTLEELSPYHWSGAFPEEDQEKYKSFAEDIY